MLESTNTGSWCMEMADLYLWTAVRLLGMLSSEGRFARCQIFHRVSESAQGGNFAFFFLLFLNIRCQMKSSEQDGPAGVCVCSPGLSCALGLSDAARAQAAGRGRAPPLPAAANSSTLAFYLCWRSSSSSVCVCAC